MTSTDKNQRFSPSTKLEQDKAKKRELEESIDYLKEVDKPGGAQFVADTEGEKLKKKKNREQGIATDLESKKKSPVSYRERLSAFGNSQIIDLDPGWEATFIPTGNTSLKIYAKTFRGQEGVVLVLKDPKGNVYVKAVRVSYNPPIDIGAIKTMVIQAENTMDSVKGLLLSDKPKPSGGKTTPGGIYIP